VSLTVLAPDRLDDDELRRWWGRFERMSASPGIAAALLALNSSMDMRGVLPSIHVPTLLVHRDGDVLPIEGARYVAERIPGARLVELPGADHWPWLAGGDDVFESVEEFVTGKRPAPKPDRVLATVLFSDIVDSTARAAEIGDTEWRAVLMRHDSLVREAIEKERGVIVKSTGDGALARFDRPTAAVEAARDIASELANRLGLQARVGLHTGEIELVDGDVAGMTVNVAARIGALASPGEVLVSRTVRDLVLGSGLPLREAGTHALKGVPDTWELFAVADGHWRAAAEGTVDGVWDTPDEGPRKEHHGPDSRSAQESTASSDGHECPSSELTWPTPGSKSGKPSSGRETNTGRR
jgi:class 3 adenylate cyclase